MTRMNHLSFYKKNIDYVKEWSNKINSQYNKPTWNKKLHYLLECEKYCEQNSIDVSQVLPEAKKISIENEYRYEDEEECLIIQFRKELYNNFTKLIKKYNLSEEEHAASKIVIILIFIEIYLIKLKPELRTNLWNNLS